MISLFGSRIDKLSKEKRKIAFKIEQVNYKKNERNAKRGNKIQILENKCFKDSQEAERKIVELNRQLDKLVRDINSEKIYVNEVAKGEQEVYEKDKKGKMPDDTTKSNSKTKRG